MFGLKSINLKTLLLHFTFWVAVWFFYVYFFSYNSNDREYILWFSGGLLPVTMIVTYLMILILIPRLLLQKKYGKFALYFFYTLVFTAHSVVVILYACLILILKFNISDVPPMSKNFAFVFILVYLIVGIVSLVYILNNNFRTLSRNKMLENKILEAQLQLKEQELWYLKKQIHPHFLFNTLNTIYGLALRQSMQTPEVILKLSNLLDYILYQVGKPRVRLSEEVSHIREYIELERIRFRDTLEVKFESDKIDDSLLIAPMLLIPFVENAFKHGTLDKGFLKVNISIRIREDEFCFRVDNSFNEEKGEVRINGGVGLPNIRKRLELHYKDQYELTFSNQENLFIAELKLYNLKSQTHEF